MAKPVFSKPSNKTTKKPALNKDLEAFKKGGEKARAKAATDGKRR